MKSKSRPQTLSVKCQLHTIDGSINQHNLKLSVLFVIVIMVTMMMMILMVMTWMMVMVMMMMSISQENLQLVAFCTFPNFCYFTKLIYWVKSCFRLLPAGQSQMNALNPTIYLNNTKPMS